MGKGLLAQWRRRVVARGLAGAALFAVPVAVAAAIGFGSSLSGVAGGLSSIVEGPSTTTTATQAARFNKLNRAVDALAPRVSTRRTIASTETTGSSGAGAGGGSNIGSGGSVISVQGTGKSDPPAITSPPAPDIPLLGGGSAGDTANEVNSSVTNLLQGVNNTVNGLLGGGQ
jgi:hypothetical protein